ncbi:hypothetical protein SDC9_197898 [bioreactor metagenome]|uniref:Uncharacterized protein n=1 Tax=bioreactor metagenome TaxID=1076179 RepID=A0A645IHF0_9ZZZZ
MRRKVCKHFLTPALMGKGRQIIEYDPAFCPRLFRKFLVDPDDAAVFLRLQDKPQPFFDIRQILLPHAKPLFQPVRRLRGLFHLHRKHPQPMAGPWVLSQTEGIKKCFPGSFFFPIIQMHDSQLVAGMPVQIFFLYAL